MIKYILIPILHITIYAFFFFQDLKRDFYITIIDNDKKNPISYCNATSNGRIIGVSSENGIMKIRVGVNDTSIFLSHLGYEVYELDVQDLYSNRDTVYLKNTNIEIPEIIISATKLKYVKKKIGITKKRNDHSRFINKNALYIPNKNQLKGYTIESVHIYIRNRGYPFTPFYISIYDAEADSIAPKEELLKIGSVRTISNIVDGFHVVSFKQHKIEFGPSGVFVVIEADLEKEPMIEKVKLGKYSFDINHVTLVIGEGWDELNKCYGWYFEKDLGWKREEIHTKNVPNKFDVYLGNPMIYITVSKIK
ncbi:MAG: hypothetical protein PHU27_12310 [Salinivirgaceae bacterium]|nr:hypothetical protein [Salinivirgaceae bacterium]